MMYVLILGMTLMGAVASVFFKRASDSDGLKSLLMNYNLYVGGGLYFIASLVNIFVLKFLDYSVVLPLTSFTYMWTILFAVYILDEKMTVKKILGTICIIIGAVFVAS